MLRSAPSFKGGDLLPFPGSCPANTLPSSSGNEETWETGGTATAMREDCNAKVLSGECVYTLVRDLFPNCFFSFLFLACKQESLKETDSKKQFLEIDSNRF
jgi:hypothetical protein